MSDLARCDPLPRVISWLSTHPDVTAALGGAGRVGMRNAPPYPMLRVIDPPGGDGRDLRWLIATSVQIEAFGDLAGAPGKAELRRILFVALGALKELPDQPTPAGGPVITEVSASGGAGWSPEPNGQPRYVASALIHSHALPATP